MIPLILLFLGGIDFPGLIIVLIILAVPGFFIWRALLKFLIAKGPKGINIAAVIMGAVQTPILVLMIGGLIYWIIVSRETMQAYDDQVSLAQKEMQRHSQIDTTEVDVISVSPDKCKILLENDYVRVLEYTLAPGEKDNPHTHPPKTYYVVEGGKLRVYPENAEPFDADELKGAVEWGDHVGMHYVENIGTTTVKLVVTEVKDAAY